MIALFPFGQKKDLTTAQVRRIVYDRQQGNCISCSKFVTWDQAHLHEKIFRSRGGKVTPDNCEILCFECHEGKKGIHGKRRPQFKGGKE
jgi:5-methylcytosine-specific restriction endonuclease McrA